MDCICHIRIKKKAGNGILFFWLRMGNLHVVQEEQKTRVRKIKKPYDKGYVADRYLFESSCSKSLRIKGPRLDHPESAVGDIDFQLFIKRQKSQREHLYTSSPLLPKRLREEGSCLCLLWVKHGREEGFSGCLLPRIPCNPMTVSIRCVGELPRHCWCQGEGLYIP